MNLYDLIKTLHIISSVLLVGTGLGSAFYLFYANRSGSLPAQAVVGRLVVRADWWFTAPCIVIQPVSGIAMAHLAGWPLSTPWLTLSLILYVLAGVCWLPVVWLQIRMAALAAQAHATATALPALYTTYQRRWEMLGYPAFLAMAATYFLMVGKPALWG
ncbi:MAG: DUF2269 domain-containing protein [Gallionellaceae bacterium]|jgi:uncharacterized membrane protein|nr:DUF2269 domain-containing protein [Gallionellaceae bacterium]